MIHAVILSHICHFCMYIMFFLMVMKLIILLRDFMVVITWILPVCPSVRPSVCHQLMFSIKAESMLIITRTNTE